MWIDDNVLRFEFQPINSNMYIFLYERNAIVVDPNVSTEAQEELKKRSIDSLTILLTHEHYDHTSGVAWLESRFKSELICQTRCAHHISKPRNNRPVLIMTLLQQAGVQNINEVIKSYPQLYKCVPDIVFDEELVIDRFGSRIIMRSTPGHSPGSCCIEIDDRYLVSGDSILQYTPVITRFPGGSIEEYEKYTLPYLRSIGKNLTVLPGHGTPFGLSESILFSENEEQVQTH